MDRQQARADIGQAVIHTHATDGKAICIRTIRHSDEKRMREGIARLSETSRYLRFFSAQPMPSDKVIEQLLDVDGSDHIAWGAIHMDGANSPAIGAVHAIRDENDPRIGEYSVAIVDDYHSIGIGRMLTTVLLINCAAQGIGTLNIQMLAENRGAIQFIKSIGGEMDQWEAAVCNLTLDVRAALAAIAAKPPVEGITEIFAVLGSYIPR
ncbi:N-acetyltransferase family protein [Blastomonas sp.]|uniref:GNAT family N-acetyltransferase n=1 Tax=Blastomonas sp. TaxID=1909299 RepID=UPI0035945827